MGIPKISLTTAATILAVGALLNLASTGALGETVADIADYVTGGYA